MDKLSAGQRHATMAAIRSKDTKPEWIVRRGLWSRGFRYRLNQRRFFISCDTSRQMAEIPLYKGVS